MKTNKLRHISLGVLLVSLMAITGCSTQKNTSTTRWWQAFNTRYNVYYNASVAYINGSLEKENGNKDNFTELLPLYSVSNKDNKELGKSSYETAIKKCEKAIHKHSIKHKPEWTKDRKKNAKDIEWLSRKEYNPFIWKAWLLMGRSQFFSGQFEEAASTFSYMSRLYASQPAIYGKARAWLAKCYIEQGWIYDTEDVIRNMERDSIDWRAQKEWDYTYADYYIHIGNFTKAIPYLRKVIRHEMRRKQKAREWYLMGQIQAALGNKKEATKAFKHVIRLYPPYELEFNARIAMTEVMAGGEKESKKMIRKLHHMGASDKNKDYLDQVYYAIGNIYLSQKDTTHAISAYEKGNVKATRNGIEKGVLLLHLGDLYWTTEKFSDARRCYGEAIGLLDKDRKDYEQLSNRSKMLDELVPYTEAVQLQDSLQTLAKMGDKDRNAAIDRVIEALKKKEKEERRKAAENNATQTQNGGMGNSNFTNNQQNKNTTTNNNQNSLWYFYNPSAVNLGKSTFQRQWGKRENVDNWQRINKTVVSSLGGAEEMTDQMRDSLSRAQELADSLKQINDSDQNNPHKRAYYLAQIPFSEEKLQASNKILEDGLYNSGVIFKDKINNLALGEKNLRRLVDHYPDYEHLDDAYYHLFLLYSRKNQPDMANLYLQKLKANYPNSQWTGILTDPYFVENAKFGTHIEDSLYAATYEAFKADRFDEVTNNCKISTERFPIGANRDKFLFIGGMSKLNNNDAEGCVKDMKTVVEKYPESKLSEMAGMIVNGVHQGKRLHGAKFDLGDVWNRRSVVLNDSDKKVKDFSNERNVNFVFMLAYKPDSVNENQLLYELAKFNFTCFLVRDFNITIEDADGLHEMMVTGFRNYDEALQYAHLFYKQQNIVHRLGQSRTYVISEPNLQLLGTRFTYNDYDQYYTKHFAPLKASTYRLLTEPDEIETEKEPEPTQEEIDKALNDKNAFDNGLDINPSDQDSKSSSDNDTFIIPEENKTEGKTTDSNNIVIPEENKTEGTAGNNDIIILEENKIDDKATDSNDIIIPEENKIDDKATDSNDIIIPEENKIDDKATDSNDIVIPEENKIDDKATDSNDIVIPEDGKQDQKKSEDQQLTIPEEKTEKAKDSSKAEEKKDKKETSNPKKSGKEVLKSEKSKTQEQKTNTPVQKSETIKKTTTNTSTVEDTGIYFDDGSGTSNDVPEKKEKQTETKPQEKKQDLELEDEYYDLEGF